ncbi:MAG: aldo/keto reductase [Bryobacteraceae bacterium]
MNISRRRLGATDLFVSRVGLGTVALGLDYGIPVQGSKLRPAVQEASLILQAGLDMGVRLIDTARAYGESESIIGAAIGHRRHEYILASKVAPFPGEPQKVRESVEASLRALRTDHIDMMQIHCGVADALPDSSTTEALLELKRSGEIRYLGASVYGEEAGMSAMASGYFDCLQVAYNALDRRLEETLLPAARQAKMGILARSVLMKGALTERADGLPEEFASLKVAAKELERLASDEVEYLPELAYRYALSEPAIDSVLAGVTSIRELEQSLRWAARGALSVELLSRIRAMPMLPDQILSPAHWPVLV